MGFNGGLMEIYPVVNIQKAMERSTIVNGKIHDKWAIFHSYVKLPEGSDSWIQTRMDLTS